MAKRLPPSAAEVQRSIAATIYSVRRGRAIHTVSIRPTRPRRADAGSAEAVKALRHLVERNGIGLSGEDFFGWAAARGWR